MAEEKKPFVEGMRVFKPKDGAPDYIIANLVINKKDLRAWLADQDEEEIKVDIKLSQKGGYYAAVNNYKKPA